MCGITGFISSRNDFDNLKVLRAMTSELIHRGPDFGETYIDDRDGIYFGHRRLSILDLSKAGNQPMKSNSGRYIIVFNGEIYNHNNLRKMLKENFQFNNWKGNSDTETLINMFDYLGIAETLKLVEGMFALSVMDNKEKKVILARDRIGEKPLYFSKVKLYSDNFFLFSSELKSFHKFPYFKKDIDNKSLQLFFKYKYIPAPHTIFKDTYKLRPGSFIEVNIKSLEITEKLYWNTKSETRRAKNNLFKGTFEDAQKILSSKLKDAVKKQLISDVPLGAFLSGGVDSSLVVSIMREVSGSNVNTFNVGFNEIQYDESTYATEVANYLGTNHSQINVNAQDLINTIPKLPFLYDEPFSDSSQIPTYLISKFASTKVKVALSGDAGDELFSGYNRYLFVEKYWKVLSKIPLSFRLVLSKIILGFSTGQINYLNNQVNLSKFNKKQINLGQKLHKLAFSIKESDIYHFYDKVVSDWKDNDEDLFINEKKIEPQNINLKLDYFSDTEKFMFMDLIDYLPNDILCKVDRAAMSVSLETRLPFLDTEVIKFAWGLPLEYKQNKKGSKWILRKILNNYLPNDYIDRPKMGFGVPISKWFRNDLKVELRDMLELETLKKENVLNYKNIEKKWNEHISGKRNWQDELWSVVMFNLWKNEFK